MIFGPHRDAGWAQQKRAKHVFHSGNGELQALTWSTEPFPDSGTNLTIGCAWKSPTLDLNFPPVPPPAFNDSAVCPPNAGDQEDWFGFANDDWYYSTAPAHGIIGIEICTDKEREDEPTIGVMLHYENDRRECLGQWRADRSVSKKYDFPCFPMVRRYRYSNYRSPALQVIVLQADESREKAHEAEYEELPVVGDLLWWFGPYGNVLDFLVDS